MNLIDLTYFRPGVIHIPNLSAYGEAGTTISEIVNQAISEHEPDILKKALGDELYAAFVAGMEATTPEAKWTSLANIIRDETVKISFVADWVYYQFRKEQATQMAGMVDVRQKFENADGAFQPRKMAQVWNRCRVGVMALYNFLRVNETTYPEWTPRIYTGICSHDALVTLPESGATEDFIYMYYASGLGF